MWLLSMLARRVANMRLNVARHMRHGAQVVVASSCHAFLSFETSMVFLSGLQLVREYKQHGSKLSSCGG
jgi:hypothetical protein